ncbi:hypothetical protein PYK01_11480 [Staphylococcus epidermidis]|nr:hypothetical protein [Staphylococcus epidermidis]MDH8981714.1 hypothetical protein [Staphylococcus epidermidis]MDH8988707.1 hypothetical protein [Staphylococcus epidermidis]MDH8993357.1 hypothetical protein [Staphylococcus epidermidis]MDH8995648.1 hypothetical protein [Staphylococcus epidermidis]
MIKNVNYFTFKDKVKYVAEVSNLTDRAIARVVDLPVDLVEGLKKNANDKDFLDNVTFETAEKIDKNFNALIKKEAFRMNAKINHFEKRDKLHKREIELLKKEIDEERYKAIYKEVYKKEYETMGE